MKTGKVRTNAHEPSIFSPRTTINSSKKSYQSPIFDRRKISEQAPKTIYKNNYPHQTPRSPITKNPKHPPQIFDRRKKSEQPPQTTYDTYPKKMSTNRKEKRDSINKEVNQILMNQKFLSGSLGIHTRNASEKNSKEEVKPTSKDHLPQNCDKTKKSIDDSHNSLKTDISKTHVCAEGSAYLNEILNEVHEIKAKMKKYHYRKADDLQNITIQNLQILLDAKTQRITLLEDELHEYKN